MRNLKFYLIASLMISTCISLIACGKCADRKMKECYLSNDDLTIVGMYKESNWWVYENTDNTERDSIYVREIEKSFTGNRSSCKKWEEFSGEFGDSNSNESMSDRFFAQTVRCNNVYLYIYFNLNNSETLLVASYKDDFVFQENLVLHGVEYTDVSVIQHQNSDVIVFYKRNIGIIGWVNPATQDTFGLIKYHI